MPMMVAFFAVNLYLGNWLKNLFALARPPTARGPASFDFSWPSLYAVNSVGLPFFALRYWFGAFGTGTAFSAEYQITTGVLYATAIVWVLLTCGARLYSGASSPADVQGGMLMGGIFVRIWLPLSDVASAWIVAPDAQLLGVPQWAVLIAIGILALLLHPFTPGEPRSWIAFAFSVKAVAFGYAFIVGSNLCARLQCAADVLGPAGTDLWVPLTDVRVLARCAAARPPARRHAPRPALSHGLTARPLRRLRRRLLARNALGFGALAASYQLAKVACAATEARAPKAAARVPCAGMFARNFVTFFTMGGMISLGVPLLFQKVGL